MKGPKLNNISRNFTTRDCLGIEGVATSISAEICPVVNTVTPRAFYWPFMVWIYYDFYKYSGIEERSYKAFDEYLKRQDYFFVLANLLVENLDQMNLVGKQQTEMDIRNNPLGPYEANPAYFKTRFGGMQYYNAGCLSMSFVIDYNPVTDKAYSFPKLTLSGEEMALAFENIIKDTEYYKKYRKNNLPVPRDVLIEYGKVINIGLKGFDKCKKILRHSLFETKKNVKLAESASYIKYLVDNYNIDSLNLRECRKIFFYHIGKNGENINIPNELKTIANEWELVVGRQYFTSGLEMIWKIMLDKLIKPLSSSEWIENIVFLSSFEWDLNQNLGSIIADCNCGFEDKEAMINDIAKGKNEDIGIGNAIKILLSIYNKFSAREDFGEEKAYFLYGIDNKSISLSEFFETVDKFKKHSIVEFVMYIMKHWLIEQHYITAFEKLMQNRDGFYYEIVDGRYIKKHDYGMDFQGIRLIQLMQVMKDLDML